MPESEPSSVLKGPTPSTGLRTVPESEPSIVLKGPTPSNGLRTVPESKVLSVIKGQSPSTGLRMVPESFECAKGPAGVSGEQCSNLIQSIHFAVCTTTVTLT